MNDRSNGLIFAAALLMPLVLIVAFTAVLVAGNASQGCSATGMHVGTPTQGSGSWSVEQMSNAAAIVNAGAALGLSARDQTIGVMTAIGESTLRVLDYGDAAGPDSRGLFQQRANGAWGTLADRMDPTISATNFFKALAQVQGRDQLSPTQVAHAVQRNANPDHYTPFWDPATQIVAQLAGDPNLAASLSGQGVTCGTGGPVPAGMVTDCPPSGMGSEARLQVTALNLLRCIHATFPQIRDIGGYRANAIDMQGHPAGLGLDVMIPGWNTPAGLELGNQVAAWLQAHTVELNVKYLIWRQRHWEPKSGWRAMADRGDPTANHMDHVHITVWPPA